MSARSWTLHPCIIAALAIGMAGCVTSPKSTVLNLDTTDRKWASRPCVAARKAVFRYDDRATARGVVGVVGNLVAPLAGTAASLGMSAAQDKERARLNARVEAACVTKKKPARSRMARR